MHIDINHKPLWRVPPYIVQMTAQANDWYRFEHSNNDDAAFVFVAYSR